MRYRAFGNRIQIKSKLQSNSLSNIFNTVLRDERAYATSLTDRMTSRSVPRPAQRVKSDESRPHRGGLGPPNHIKESIKIRAQGCHITSRDVTFNAEILKYGRDILRAQFKQGEPPEYALTTFAQNSAQNACQLKNPIVAGDQEEKSHLRRCVNVSHTACFFFGLGANESVYAWFLDLSHYIRSSASSHFPEKANVSCGGVWRPP
jgi:hypothetical protein